MKRTFVKRIIFLGIIVLLIPTVLIYTMQENEEDITITDEPMGNDESMESADVTFSDETYANGDETSDTTMAPQEEIDIEEIDTQAPQDMQDDTESEFSAQDQLMAEETEDTGNNYNNYNYTDNSTDEPMSEMPDEFMENNYTDEE